MDFYSVMSTKIKSKIVESNKTHKECATHLDTTEATFSKKVNNPGMFRVNELGKLCEFINADISYFF